MNSSILAGVRKRNSLNANSNRKNKWMNKALPWLFMLPALCIISFVVVGPSGGTLILSLTDWDGIKSPDFIGMDNYVKLVHDPYFYAALSNNFKWMAFFCTIPITLGLAIAMWVSRVGRGQMFYRSSFFLPNMLATVVIAKIWSWLYNPFFGVNVLLKNWGIENPPSWLGDPSIALLSVAVADAWSYVGFLMILFLTSLHQADKNIEEAALVEGANKLQIFWNVILPQLRPIFVLIMMLTMIWSFKSFDYVFIMTQGGPGNATEMISTYMYKEALYGQKPGYASTVALAMALFSFLIIGGFGILKKKGWDI